MSEFIQLHFLTAYPPANLNRDDLGRPKTAVVGGTQRLRISSQSLKRAWRTSSVFADYIDNNLGTRTKDLGNLVFQKLSEAKVDPERAHAMSIGVAEVFGKLKSGESRPEEGGESDEDMAKKKERKKTKIAEPSASARETEQLVHVSTAELAAIDEFVARVASGWKPEEKDFEALVGAGRGDADIAMFGRMLAAKPRFSVDAAVQVAHAFTVSKVSVEDDFFTAVDDLNAGGEDMGAGHMGTTEFGSGVFYHYVCINRSQLLENLDNKEELTKAALEALCRACVQVSPTGKQNSFASRARASYLLAERGSQQPRSLSVAFLEAVAGSNVIAGAIEKLEDTQNKMNLVYGACYDDSRSFNALKGQGTLDEVCAFVAAERAK